MGHHQAPTLHRRRSLPLVAAVLLAASGYGGSVLAQDTTGSIEGVVSGPDGTPLGGVEVIATLSAPKVERRATTNRDGAFRIPALPLGEYELSIQSLGYWPVTVQSVVVRLGRSTAVPPVKLSPVGEIVETLEVFAEEPLIDPSTTTAGGNIAADVFDNLPVTRDYQSIAALLPNVSVSYLGDPVNFGGATGIENRYFVDGIDVTDPSRGLNGTMLPPDFIQEVEVKTGGYEAEYRSALGGIVNVVTPSGSDRFSGKLIGYWTSHVVSAEKRQSPLELQQKNFAQYDVGFSLSGPLARDRAWFFLAYDPATQSVDTEIPGIGYFGDSSTAHRFAGKIDWRINGSNSLAFTVTGDPAKRDGVGTLPFPGIGNPTSFLDPDPYLRRLDTGGIAVSLRGTHVLTPRLLLETALSNQWREEQNYPATDADELLLIDTSTGIWSGGSSGTLDTRSDQLTAGVKALGLLGFHEIKAGVEFRNNELRFENSGFDIVWRHSDTSYWRQAFFVSGPVENRSLSLFAQDAWRVGSRLVLNYGVRWAREELISRTGDVVQTIDDEWQPRMGFVYQPGRLGTQRIYGSVARFYQEVMTVPLVNYQMGGSLFYFCSYDHDPRLDPTGGDCIPWQSEVQPEIEGLRGQYSDDYSLGYERQLGDRHRAGVRAVYRTVGDALDDALVSATGTFVWGNPGRGALSEYPRARRIYKAVELTVEGQPSARSGYLASYVLSENRGNYVGLWNTDYDIPYPNINSFNYLDEMPNGDGVLPNDRTHVLKGSGFYRFENGLSVGSSVLWESGTPLCEYGGTTPIGGYSFLRTRGTAGRTPSIFDLSLRLDYTFFREFPGRWKPRLILDVYHLFSGRKAVDYDQIHYFNKDDDGNQIDPNPNYGMATRYYPPTTARLGLEVTF